MGKIARSDRTTRAEHGKESVVGRWFWVSDSDWDGKPQRWLGCVVREGSNYVLVRGVGGAEKRVHDDEFFAVLEPEADPQRVIDDRVRELQAENSGLMRQVTDLVRGLGIDPRALPGATGGGTALTVAAGSREVGLYKDSLRKAQEETLPALFEKIKRTNKEVAEWMAAPMLPLEAQLGTAREVVTHIKRRIYAIELYAGVTEEIVQVAGGEPAPAAEKVRLFQRRLYMDEECLVDYRAGGMEFEDIEKFDAWLLKPDNLARILPTPRCIVAMRVRRNDKERETATILDAFINFSLAESDKSTFLYIRNGENVYRLSTSIDFGESLFPDRATFDPQRPMVAKMFAGRVDEVIDRADYEAMVATDEERERNSRKWLRDHPASTWSKDLGTREFANPYRSVGASFRSDRYEPFDPSSVYYDDIAEQVSDRIAHYNRIALIVQGLFDRSPVFRPHAMAKVWKPDDFLRAVDLVYDNSEVLHAGEAPDFEAYRRGLNATLGKGSVVIGQERAWMEREAAKYNAHGERSFYRGFNPVQLHRPYGDPGPGFVTTIGEWKKKARSAIFRWKRRRATPRRWTTDREFLDASLVVPADRLLNVSAYAPGDFRKFYLDPRTRIDYIRWAPYLLGAEDWHAGRYRSGECDDD